MWCLAMWVLFKFALDTVLPLSFADFLTGVCVCVCVGGHTCAYTKLDVAVFGLG